MNNVIALHGANSDESAYEFRKLREELSLSRAQAAHAMDASIATIEYWEQNPEKAPNEIDATNKLQTFIRENGSDFVVGKNLLFGHYPLRLARELLELDVAEIAEKYGYKKSAWQSFEANRRVLKSKILEQIESDVQVYFGELCSSN